MARKFAAFRLSMWSDEDFLAITPEGQHLYFVVVTGPGLSFCGVDDWRPNRIARRARGWTSHDVEKAGLELRESRHLVVDEETEEVLARSFLRHDEVLKQPNLAVAAITDYGRVASPMLRGVIVHELKRLREEFPDFAAWAGKSSARLLEELLDRPSIDPFADGFFTPSGNPSIKGSVKGFDEPSDDPKSRGSGRGSTKPSVTPAPAPTPATSTTSAPSERAPAARQGVARNDATPEARVANGVYDHAKGMVGWESMQQIAKRALRAAGATEESVLGAMKALWDEQRPITLQTVGQRLSSASGASAPAKSTQRAQVAMELGRQVDEQIRGVGA